MMSLCKQMMGHVFLLFSVPPPSFALALAKLSCHFLLLNIFSYSDSTLQQQSLIMPRITRDPTKDECLSYDDDNHAAFREMAIAAHQDQVPLTQEEAVTNLKATWQTAHDSKVTQWNEQVIL